MLTLPAQNPPSVVVESSDALPLWLQTTVAVFTVLASAAAAVAAIAAWRSAKASLDTSRDAQDALALAIEPSVSGDVAGMTDYRCYLVVNRSEEFDATDIDVEVHRRDGTIRRTTSERLAGRQGESAYKSLEADVGPMTMTEHEADVLSEVFLRFSDGRRIARYEVHDRFHVTPTKFRERGERRRIK